jgi:hypothetical protein
MKTTTKKSTTKKPIEKVLNPFGGTTSQNVKGSLIALIETLQAQTGKAVRVDELALELTERGTPTTPKRARQTLQRERRKFMAHLTEIERKEMRSNGQIETTKGNYLLWRKVGINPIAYFSFENKQSYEAFLKAEKKGNG